MPLSIRFSTPVLNRLRRTARSRASTTSGLVSQLVDEGLRALEFPGVSFRDGPAGRRAGLISGPDIWEIISALADNAASGERAIEQVASDFSLSISQVRCALAYYGSYKSEIDQEIHDNETAANNAYESWLNQERLLA